MRKYPIDLTDNQWAKIEPFFKSRKRKHSLRHIVNALLYMTKTGVQWRMLPRCYPNWELIYYYFRRWTADGLIEEIHDALRSICRKQAGRKESPSLGLLDSQSVKTSCITQEKGYDAGKKVSGRNRTSRRSDSCAFYPLRVFELFGKFFAEIVCNTINFRDFVVG
jgi:putative transposase